MDAATRRAMRRRAQNCCEYCQRRQADSPLIALHIEHVIARKHGGQDAIDNLALACAECNLHKGSNLSGIDPESGKSRRFIIRAVIDGMIISHGRTCGWSGAPPPAARRSTHLS